MTATLLAVPNIASRACASTGVAGTGAAAAAETGAAVPALVSVTAPPFVRARGLGKAATGSAEASPKSATDADNRDSITTVGDADRAAAVSAASAPHDAVAAEPAAAVDVVAVSRTGRRKVSRLPPPLRGLRSSNGERDRDRESNRGAGGNSVSLSTHAQPLLNLTPTDAAAQTQAQAPASVQTGRGESSPQSGACQPDFHADVESHHELSPSDSLFPLHSTLSGHSQLHSPTHANSEGSSAGQAQGLVPSQLMRARSDLSAHSNCYSTAASAVSVTDSALATAAAPLVSIADSAGATATEAGADGYERVRRAAVGATGVKRIPSSKLASPADSTSPSPTNALQKQLQQRHAGTEMSDDPTETLLQTPPGLAFSRRLRGAGNVPADLEQPIALANALLAEGDLASVQAGNSALGLAAPVKEAFYVATPPPLHCGAPPPVAHDGGAEDLRLDDSTNLALPLPTVTADDSKEHYARHSVASSGDRRLSSSGRPAVTVTETGSEAGSGPDNVTPVNAAGATALATAADGAAAERLNAAVEDGDNNDFSNGYTGPPRGRALSHRSGTLSHGRSAAQPAAGSQGGAGRDATPPLAGGGAPGSVPGSGSGSAAASHLQSATASAVPSPTSTPHFPPLPSPRAHAGAVRRLPPLTPTAATSASATAAAAPVFAADQMTSIVPVKRGPEALSPFLAPATGPVPAQLSVAAPASNSGSGSGSASVAASATASPLLAPRARVPMSAGYVRSPSASPSPSLVPIALQSGSLPTASLQPLSLITLPSPRLLARAHAAAAARSAVTAGGGSSGSASMRQSPAMSPVVAGAAGASFGLDMSLAGLGAAHSAVAALFPAHSSAITAGNNSGSNVSAAPGGRSLEQTGTRAGSAATTVPASAGAGVFALPPLPPHSPPLMHHQPPAHAHSHGHAHGPQSHPAVQPLSQAQVQQAQPVQPQPQQLHLNFQHSASSSGSSAGLHSGAHAGAVAQPYLEWSPRPSPRASPCMSPALPPALGAAASNTALSSSSSLALASNLLHPPPQRTVIAVAPGAHVNILSGVTLSNTYFSPLHSAAALSEMRAPAAALSPLPSPGLPAAAGTSDGGVARVALHAALSVVPPTPRGAALSRATVHLSANADAPVTVPTASASATDGDDGPTSSASVGAGAGRRFSLHDATEPSQQVTQHEPVAAATTAGNGEAANALKARFGGMRRSLTVTVTVTPTLAPTVISPRAASPPPALLSPSAVTAGTTTLAVPAPVPVLSAPVGVVGPAATAGEAPLSASPVRGLARSRAHSHGHSRAHSPQHAPRGYKLVVLEPAPVTAATRGRSPALAPGSGASSGNSAPQPSRSDGGAEARESERDGNRMWCPVEDESLWLSQTAHTPLLTCTNVNTHALGGTQLHLQSQSSQSCMQGLVQGRTLLSPSLQQHQQQRTVTPPSGRSGERLHFPSMTPHQRPRPTSASPTLSADGHSHSAYDVVAASSPAPSMTRPGWGSAARAAVERRESARARSDRLLVCDNHYDPPLALLPAAATATSAATALAPCNLEGGDDLELAVAAPQLPRALCLLGPAAAASADVAAFAASNTLTAIAHARARAYAAARASTAVSGARGTTRAMSRSSSSPANLCAAAENEAAAAAAEAAAVDAVVADGVTRAIDTGLIASGPALATPWMLTDYHLFVLATAMHNGTPAAVVQTTATNGTARSTTTSKDKQSAVTLGACAGLTAITGNITTAAKSAAAKLSADDEAGLSSPDRDDFVFYSPALGAAATPQPPLLDRSPLSPPWHSPVSPPAPTAAQSLEHAQTQVLSQPTLDAATAAWAGANADGLTAPTAAAPVAPAGSLAWFLAHRVSPALAPLSLRARQRGGANIPACTTGAEIAAFIAAAVGRGWGPAAADAARATVAGSVGATSPKPVSDTKSHSTANVAPATLCKKTGAEAWVVALGQILLDRGYLALVHPCAGSSVDANRSECSCSCSCSDTAGSNDCQCESECICECREGATRSDTACGGASCVYFQPQQTTYYRLCWPTVTVLNAPVLLPPRLLPSLALAHVSPTASAPAGTETAAAALGSNATDAAELAGFAARLAAAPLRSLALAAAPPRPTPACALYHSSSAAASLWLRRLPSWRACATHRLLLPAIASAALNDCEGRQTVAEAATTAAAAVSAGARLAALTTAVLAVRALVRAAVEEAHTVSASALARAAARAADYATGRTHNDAQLRTPLGDEALDNSITQPLGPELPPAPPELENPSLAASALSSGRDDEASFDGAFVPVALNFPPALAPLSPVPGNQAARLQRSTARHSAATALEDSAASTSSKHNGVTRTQRHRVEHSRLEPVGINRGDPVKSLMLPSLINCCNAMSGTHTLLPQRREYGDTNGQDDDDSTKSKADILYALLSLFGANADITALSALAAAAPASDDAALAPSAAAALGTHCAPLAAARMHRLARALQRPWHALTPPFALASTAATARVACDDSPSCSGTANSSLASPLFTPPRWCDPDALLSAGCSSITALARAVAKARVHGGHEAVDHNHGYGHSHSDDRRRARKRSRTTAAADNAVGDCVSLLINARNLIVLLDFFTSQALCAASETVTSADDTTLSLALLRMASLPLEAISVSISDEIRDAAAAVHRSGRSNSAATQSQCPLGGADKFVCAGPIDGTAERVALTWLALSPNLPQHEDSAAARHSESGGSKHASRSAMATLTRLLAAAGPRATTGLAQLCHACPQKTNAALASDMNFGASGPQRLSRRLALILGGAVYTQRDLEAALGLHTPLIAANLHDLVPPPAAPHGHSAAAMATPVSPPTPTVVLHPSAMLPAAAASAEAAFSLSDPFPPLCTVPVVHLARLAQHTLFPFLCPRTPVSSSSARARAAKSESDSAATTATASAAAPATSATVDVTALVTASSMLAVGHAFARTLPPPAAAPTATLLQLPAPPPISLLALRGHASASVSSTTTAAMIALTDNNVPHYLRLVPAPVPSTPVTASAGPAAAAALVQAVQLDCNAAVSIATANASSAKTGTKANTGESSSAPHSWLLRACHDSLHWQHAKAFVHLAPAAAHCALTSDRTHDRRRDRDSAHAAPRLPAAVAGAGWRALLPLLITAAFVAPTNVIAGADASADRSCRAALQAVPGLYWHSRPVFANDGDRNSNACDNAGTHTGSDSGSDSDSCSDSESDGEGTDSASTGDDNGHARGSLATAGGRARGLRPVPSWGDLAKLQRNRGLSQQRRSRALSLLRGATCAPAAWVRPARNSATGEHGDDEDGDTYQPFHGSGAAASLGAGAARSAAGAAAKAHAARATETLTRASVTTMLIGAGLAPAAVAAWLRLLLPVSSSSAPATATTTVSHALATAIQARTNDMWSAPALTATTSGLRPLLHARVLTSAGAAPNLAVLPCSLRRGGRGSAVVAALLAAGRARLAAPHAAVTVIRVDTRGDGINRYDRTSTSDSQNGDSAGVTVNRVELSARALFPGTVATVTLPALFAGAGGLGVGLGALRPVVRLACSQSQPVAAPAVTAVSALVAAVFPHRKTRRAAALALGMRGRSSSKHHSHQHGSHRGHHRHNQSHGESDGHGRSHGHQEDDESVVLVQLCADNNIAGETGTFATSHCAFGTASDADDECDRCSEEDNLNNSNGCDDHARSVSGAQVGSAVVATAMTLSTLAASDAVMAAALMAAPESSGHAGDKKCHEQHQWCFPEQEEDSNHHRGL